MVESPPTAVEILALGRATFEERLGQGDTTAAALDAALGVVIAAEQAACITVAGEWIDTGGRYGFTGDQVAKRIVEDLGDRTRPGVSDAPSLLLPDLPPSASRPRAALKRRQTSKPSVAPKN